MGRRGKDLTPEVKKITLNLLNESYSGHKISQVVGVIPRTVKKNLKRVRERGNPPQTRQTEKNGHTR
jgi:transposase-like protein